MINGGWGSLFIAAHGVAAVDELGEVAARP